MPARDPKVADRSTPNFRHIDSTPITTNRQNTSNLIEWQWIQRLDGSGELADSIDTHYIWYHRIGSHMLRSTSGLSTDLGYDLDLNVSTTTNAQLSWGSVTECGNLELLQTNNRMQDRHIQEDNGLQGRNQRSSFQRYRSRGIQKNNRHMRSFRRS